MLGYEVAVRRIGQSAWINRLEVVYDHTQLLIFYRKDLYRCSLLLFEGSTIHCDSREILNEFFVVGWITP